MSINHINLLLKEHSTTLLLIFVLIAAIIEGTTILDKFINLFGFETKWSRTKKKQFDTVQSHDIMLHSILEQFNDIEKKLDSLTSKVDTTTSEVTLLKNEFNRGKVNELRDRLLQIHRYYSNPSMNPSASWNRMEAEAFWKLFGEYEDRGGDGYIHSVVQPDMNKLSVADIYSEGNI